MIKLRTLLNELIVKDLTSKKDTTKYFLAYKDKLFIFDGTSNLISIKKHIRPHPAIDPKRKYSAIEERDVWDFVNSAGELAPDIVVGSYIPSEDKIIVYSHSEIQPLTSLMVKKIAIQLGVHTISREFCNAADYNTPSGDDDIEVQYPLSKLIGGVPKVVYHGTNSRSLNTILKFGLDPGRGPSKFAKRGIVHPEHIFFTATFEEATFYAINAVEEDPSKQKWDNFPIIVEFTIPDPDLLKPDFDADYSTTSPRYYPKVHAPSATKTSMKAMGVSRETGKWGYKGRIPAQFIRWVYYYKPYEHKWHKSRPDVWAKLLDKYDWENIAYKLGLHRMDQL